MTINMQEDIWFVECRIDTRHYDLDTGKAIPGTGDTYACDCCGKDHEVWVYVRSKAGEVGIVGTSCAKKAPHLLDRNLLGANYTTSRRNGALYQKDHDRAIHHR